MSRPNPKTGAELIAAAGQMVPVLRERAGLAEELRRVPEESIEEIQRASLLHLFKPRRYGGFELGLEEYVELTMELARGCSATSWAFALLCEHSIFVSLFPLEAQDDIWSKDSYALIAASITAPDRTMAKRVPGGFRLSGKFSFASGSDHAQWLMFASRAEPRKGSSEEAEVLYFLIPKEELTPVDDWFVMGMRGTGSHSWAADDVFIPEHRSTTREDMVSGRRGPELHPTFNLIHYGRGPITTFVVSGPVTGMAQGAVDRFTEIAQTASRNRAGRLVDSEVAQLALAESAVEAFSARTLLEAGARDQMELVRKLQPIPQELQRRVGRDAAYVGVLARRSIDRLHGALGSQAVFDGHPLNQALRDVHTAVAQVALNWERLGVSYGRQALDESESATLVNGSHPSFVR